MTAVSADLPNCAGAASTERDHVIQGWTRTAHHRTQMDAVGAAPGFFCDEAVIGTNSIGMAASTRGAVLVRGFEHYADAFTHITCASRAVVDPFTGQVLGVVNMTIADPAPWQLMTAPVGRVDHETHQRLLDEAGSKSVALYKTFLQARRRAKGPLAAVDGSSFYANAAGSRLVASSDRAALWAWAQRCVRQSAGSTPPLQLPFGTATAECEAIHDGTQLIGAVIRFAGVPADALAGGHSGWGRLTDAERSVAELVAAGYTNREAATTLFLSPHTVDYHLRHIFRKLDIESRIQLARIVEQNQYATSTDAADTVRAIIQDGYGGVDELSLGEVARPEPAEDEVLVRVRAASVHPDVWHVVTGRPAVLRLMGAGVRRPKDRVPGTDVAGVVESVGAAVTRFRPGDEVLRRDDPRHPVAQRRRVRRVRHRARGRALRSSQPGSASRKLPRCPPPG